VRIIQKYHFVKSHPHIGKDYCCGISGLRILILGESHYRENGKGLYERYTRDVVHERKESANTKRFFGRIADLFEIEDDAFWNQVAFYNYIQVSLPRARIRPEEDMWRGGLRAFREVLARLSPQFILVLGKALWENLPGPEQEQLFISNVNVSSAYGEQTGCLYRTAQDGGRVLLFAISHPSSFGWTVEKWRPWVKHAMSRARKRTLPRWDPLRF
jgi:hypothetical protein